LMPARRFIHSSSSRRKLEILGNRISILGTWRPSGRGSGLSAGAVLLDRARSAWLAMDLARRPTRARPASLRETGLAEDDHARGAVKHTKAAGGTSPRQATPAPRPAAPSRDLGAFALGAGVRIGATCVFW
jgi:hypothetical protein